MSDERSAFSRRLADAMRAAGHEPRPGVLERLFNQRYGGKSVAFQTASRWLSGHAIPQQDKLRVLGEIFGVQPHVLQYGERGVIRVAEVRVAWPTGAAAVDRQAFNDYLRLPAAKRQLVREFIAALAGRGS